MEIHGYEKAITFGQSKEIYCITHLNVTHIEWFRVGADDRPLEKSCGNQQLTMTVDTKRARLNGAIFTCRVTDVEGNQYEESVSIRVKGEWYDINIWCFTFRCMEKKNPGFHLYLFNIQFYLVIHVLQSSYLATASIACACVFSSWT